MNLERFQYTPPWKLSSWGLPLKSSGFDRLKLVGRGGDEWGNPSVYIIIPLVGMFVFFYGRDFDRSTWFRVGFADRKVHYISPDYTQEAELWQLRTSRYVEHGMQNLSIYEMLEDLDRCNPQTRTQKDIETLAITIKDVD